MEFQDVVRRRRMVREYADTPVDPAVVDRALANAVRAPSAGFSQGWAFLVLDRPDDVAASGRSPPTPGRAGPDSWLAGMMRAPGRRGPLLQQGGLPRPLRRARQGLDRPGRGPLAGAVLAHGRRHGSLLILLTAVDEGLGACFFGIPPEHDRHGPRDAFGIPRDFDPVGAITLGHRAEDPGNLGSRRTPPPRP